MIVILKNSSAEFGQPEVLDRRAMSYEELVGFIRLTETVNLVSFHGKMFKPMDTDLVLSDSRAELEEVTIYMEEQRYDTRD
jgi:hypothetical protein